jgi:hypothetical protein
MTAPDKAVDSIEQLRAFDSILFLSYTSGISALPLFYLFRVVRIAFLVFFIRPATPSQPFSSFRFSLLYTLGAGSLLLQPAPITQRACFYSLHRTTHHTHFRPPRYTILVIRKYILITGHLCTVSVQLGGAQKIYALLDLPEG